MAYSSNPQLENAFQLRLRQGEEEAQRRRKQAMGQASISALERGREGTAFEGARLGQAEGAYSRDIGGLQSQLASEAAAIETEDRRTGEARQFARGERLGSQEFAAGQAGEQRRFLTSERVGGQDYAAQQNLLGRQYGTSERLGSQEFAGREAQLGRDFGAGQALLSRQYGTSEREAQQGYGTSERLAGQDFQSRQLAAQQGFASREADLSRSFGSNEAAMQRQAEMGEAGRERRQGTINSAIGAAGSIGGALLGAGKLGALGALGPAGLALGGAAIAAPLLAKPISKAAKSVKKLFCFEPNTLVEMSTGATKPIGSVQLGDELRGGKVESVRYSYSGDVYRYFNILVTGSHAVLEPKGWVRVKDSVLAQKVDQVYPVVSLVTSNHRIFSWGQEFADEFETNDYESLTADASLLRLNLELAKEKEEAHA